MSAESSWQASARRQLPRRRVDELPQLAGRGGPRRCGPPATADRAHSGDVVRGHARACVPPISGNEAHGFWNPESAVSLSTNSNASASSACFASVRLLSIVCQHDDLAAGRLLPHASDRLEADSSSSLESHRSTSGRNRPTCRNAVARSLALGEPQHPVVRPEHKPQAAAQARVALGENDANRRLAGLASGGPG